MLTSAAGSPQQALTSVSQCELVQLKINFGILVQFKINILHIVVGGTGVNDIKAWVCDSASAGTQVVCGLNVSPNCLLHVQGMRADVSEGLPNCLTC